MVSGKAIATFLLFILSLLTAKSRVTLPLGRNRHFTFNSLSTPIIIISLLWASQCLELATILHGITGTDGVKPYNVLISFLSLTYMTITLDATGISRVAADWICNTLSGKNGKKLFVYLHLSITVWTCFFGSDLVILITYVLVYYTTVPGSLPHPIRTSWWTAIPYSQRVVGYVNNKLPTLYSAFPRLPFALVSFAFAQFILVEALFVQGWIDIFADWLRSATNEDMLWTFWIMFFTSDILIRISGTNIEGTILLIKVVRVADLPDDSRRAARVALGIASSAWAIRQVFNAGEERRLRVR